MFCIKHCFYFDFCIILQVISSSVQCFESCLGISQVDNFVERYFSFLFKYTILSLGILIYVETDSKHTSTRNNHFWISKVSSQGGSKFVGDRLTYYAVRCSQRWSIFISRMASTMLKRMVSRIKRKFNGNCTLIPTNIGI